MKQANADRISDVFAAVVKFKADNGYPPTLREISDITGIPSFRQCAVYLDRLEELGFIERDAGIPRAIRILSPLEKQTTAA